MLVFYSPMLRARVFLFPSLLAQRVVSFLQFQPDLYLSYYLFYLLYYLFLYSLSLHLDRFALCPHRQPYLFQNSIRLSTLHFLSGSRYAVEVFQKIQMYCPPQELNNLCQRVYETNRDRLTLPCLYLCEQPQEIRQWYSRWHLRQGRGTTSELLLRGRDLPPTNFHF